jgi:hypothetical protein
LSPSGAEPEAPAGPTRTGRDPLGRFVKGNEIGTATVIAGGNTLRWEHGLRARSDNLPPELAHLDAEVREFLSEALVDEGDPALVSTRRRALLAYRARLHRRIAQLDAALEMRGLVDRRGKLRAVWLQRLEGLIGAARAIDSLLGLERRPKQATATVTSYLSTYTPTGEPHHEHRDDDTDRDA